jgi:hypothetical protein
VLSVEEGRGASGRLPSEFASSKITPLKSLALGVGDASSSTSSPTSFSGDFYFFFTMPLLEAFTVAESKASSVPLTIYKSTFRG